MTENSEFLKYSQKLWSEKYGREISMKETKEIIDNLVGYVKILLEWDSKKRSEKSIE